MSKLSELPKLAVELGMMQHGTDTMLPLARDCAILTRGVDTLVNRCNSRAKKMAVTSFHFVARPVDKVVMGIATGAFVFCVLTFGGFKMASEIAEKRMKNDAPFKRNCIRICFAAGGIGVGAVAGAVIGGAVGSALVADAVLGIVFPYPLAKAMRRAWIQGKYAEDLTKSGEKNIPQKMADLFDFNDKKPDELNKQKKLTNSFTLADFSENKLRAFVKKNPKYDCPFWSVLPKQPKPNKLGLA